MDILFQKLKKLRKKLNNLNLKYKKSINNKDECEKNIKELNNKTEILKRNIGDLYKTIDTIDKAPKIFKQTKKKHIIRTFIAEIIFIALKIIFNPNIIYLTSELIEFVLCSLGVVSFISFIVYRWNTKDIRTIIKGKNIKEIEDEIESDMIELEKLKEVLNININKFNNFNLDIIKTEIDNLTKEIVVLEKFRNAYLKILGEQLDLYFKENSQIADHIIEMAEQKRVLL